MTAGSSHAAPTAHPLRVSRHAPRDVVTAAGPRLLVRQTGSWFVPSEVAEWVELHGINLTCRGYTGNVCFTFDDCLSEWGRGPSVRRALGSTCCGDSCFSHMDANCPLGESSGSGRLWAPPGPGVRPAPHTQMLPRVTALPTRTHPFVVPAHSRGTCPEPGKGTGRWWAVKHLAEMGGARGVGPGPREGRGRALSSLGQEGSGCWGEGPGRDWSQEWVGSGQRSEHTQLQAPRPGP